MKDLEIKSMEIILKMLGARPREKQIKKKKIHKKLTFFLIKEKAYKKKIILMQTKNLGQLRIIIEIKLLLINTIIMKLSKKMMKIQRQLRQAYQENLCALISKIKIKTNKIMLKIQILQSKRKKIFLKSIKKNY